MSQFIDECNEGSIGIETIFRRLLYTDGGDYYINFLDSGLTESDVNPIDSCTDHRSLEQLFRLSIVEDLFGNPAISTVQITEGTQCIDSCDEQGLLTGSLLYQCFYLDANGNVHLGIKEGVDPCESLLLELYPNAAAAYALRLLDCDYNGNCIRVRRDSDNSERDIAFNGTLDASGNYPLDTVDLLNFVGAGNGYITTWYDQSGNGCNAINTTAAQQPQIVSAGALINVNGNTSIDFNGSSHNLGCNALAASFTGEDKPMSSFIVSKADVTNISQELISVSNNTTTIQRHQVDFSNTDYRLFRRDDGAASANRTGGVLDTNQHLRTDLFSGTVISVFADTGVVINAQAADIGTLTLNRFTIGAIETTSLGQYFNGKMQEVIIYASEKSSDRAGIESNINTFFNIYP